MDHKNMKSLKNIKIWGTARNALGTIKELDGIDSIIEYASIKILEGIKKDYPDTYKELEKRDRV